MILAVAQNNLEMALLLKMFKFFILLLSAYRLVVTADDDEFVKFGGSYFADCNAAYSRWDTHDELLQVVLWNLTEKMIDDHRHAA